jgi:ADP-ribose pyrophosphatase YjhB (NUDIX family)
MNSLINQTLTQSAGGIVLNSQNQVIVVSQGGTSWSLPKGHTEPGESFLETAKREIFEESGVKELKLIKELGSYTRYGISLDGGDDKRFLKTIHMFLFTTTESKLKPSDPHNPEAIWLDKSSVAERLTHYKDKEFFLKYLNSDN